MPNNQYRTNKLVQPKREFPMEETVTIITVSYNSTDVIEDMLLSVPSDVSVLVVDNASTDLSILKKICSKSNVKLIENDTNIGFGAACNIGAESATTDYLFFVNPDCVLKENCIDELVATALRNPRAVAFNPRIMQRDGKPSFNYKSTLLPRSQWMARGWPEDDQAINILSGCALFVRQVDFNAVGGFDSNIFLYHEDDDLSLRLSDRGPLMFSYNSIVSHSIASSSGHSEHISAFKAWHLGYSRIYAMNKHSMLLPILIVFLLALSKALLPDIIFSNYKRQKRWAFLAGISSSIISLLQLARYKKFKRKLYLTIFNRNGENVYQPHGVSVKIPRYGDVSIRYSLSKQRSYEESEANLIRKYLKFGTNVVELGGCYGVISALVRKIIGPNAQHVIVEANPDLAAICSLNANPDLRSSNTNIVIAAVDCSGTDYVEFLTGNHPHGGQVSLKSKSEISLCVRTTTLSKLALSIPQGPFALICDIEGAELQLFEKEDEVLSRLSVIILETHPSLYPNGLVDEHKILEKIENLGLQEIERDKNVVCFERKY